MSVAAALRWRLAVTIRSMRFVPPALALFAFLGIFLTQRNQAWSSIVAVDVVAAFVFAVWAAVAHAGALSPGHRDITRATVGRPVATAAELVGSVVLGLVAAVVLIAWALALRLASVGPSPAEVGGSLLAVCVVVLAGAVAGQLLDALPVGPPARFVVAVGLVTLTIARPSITVALSWPIPAVMDLAKAINGQQWSAAWATGLGVLAWSVVAAVVVDLLISRRSART